MTLESLKTDAIKTIDYAIREIDDQITNIECDLRSVIADSNNDYKLKVTLEWELAHMNVAYVELMHDLERVQRTLKGETFAG